ncbi:hypothetical protein CLOSYM_03051 [[Clostridium] symbiosum ATCC 14940]|uniref:Uncharacterized protein n=1 Tax=[Clostridium] symbiosum ATCC 14940 TaxID=411472 RepID=A0ABC9TVH1_CLOSY|nr:hypothetical protein CLOSYM_03051 [[Clostridium] symbiosum ATCC 14940]
MFISPPFPVRQLYGSFVTAYLKSIFIASDKPFSAIRKEKKQS